MPTTYGERLLAEAENRARTQRHRRRLTLLFAPATLAASLAMVGIWEQRRRALSDAGALRLVTDHLVVLVFMSVFVLGMIALAVRPGMPKVPAIIALVAGPIGMPILFGPGGSLWQWLVIATVCLLLISAGRRPTPTR
ncbi:MAG: hypothetical protein ACLGH3_10205 [Actinomycetota bacterium]